MSSNLIYVDQGQKSLGYFYITKINNTFKPLNLSIEDYQYVNINQTINTENLLYIMYFLRHGNEDLTVDIWLKLNILAK